MENVEFGQLDRCGILDSVGHLIELASTIVSDCHVFDSVSGLGLRFAEELVPRLPALYACIELVRAVLDLVYN